MRASLLLRFSPFLVLLAFLTSLAPVAPALAQSATPAASAATSPLDLANMDQAVDPGEDLYRYVNGGWLDRTTIPPERPSYGAFEELIDATEQQQIALLQGIESDAADTTPTDQEKAALIFQQGLDLETRNTQGLEPLQPSLDRIDAAVTLDDLHELWIDPDMIGFPDLFNLDVTPDPADSTVNVLWLAGPVLGLPTVDYYTDEDPANDAARESYRAVVAALLQAAGLPEAEATAAADAVYAFETELAGRMVTPEEAQDFNVLYNPVTIDDLAVSYPMLDWPAYLEALGVEGSPTIINSERELVAELDAIITATEVETIKNYLKTWVMISAYTLLGEDLEALVFPYFQTLYGVEEQAKTDVEVLGVVNGTMGDAVGRLYVDEYFPPEAKAQITTLVENVIAAFRARLEANSWMTEETKTAALEKLDAVVLKLGYPDEWKTYEKVDIGASYYESVVSAQLADFERRMATAGKPVDRTEWFALAQDVNAYYNPSLNEMVFPSGILQAPFFDLNADDAWNYGGIGGIIGHEITHGFDLQGSQFDANGNFVNWWSEEDAAAFDALNEEVVAQYGAVEVAPDLFVDGQLTVGENVADMGGLQAAYDALQTVLTDAATEEIDGFTSDQRFFIAHGTVFRELIRDEFLATLVQTDPHSPGEVRAELPAQNMDAFYDAFEIGPGDAMYLPPEDRIVVW